MANALAWVTSGVQYIMQQDFETAGLAPNWSDPASTGSTWHNTVSPLEGTGDLSVIGGSAPTFHGLLYTFPSTLSECWFVAMLECINLPSAGNTHWIGLYTTSASLLSLIRVSNTGAVTCINDGSVYGTMGSSVSSGTLYYVKSHYKKGSGADSTTTFELSTSGTFVNSGGFYQATTTGAAVVDAGIFFCRNTVDGEFRFDHIRVSATDLGNNFSSWT